MLDRRLSIIIYNHKHVPGKLVHYFRNILPEERLKHVPGKLVHYFRNILPEEQLKHVPGKLVHYFRNILPEERLKRRLTLNRQNRYRYRQHRTGAGNGKRVPDGMETLQSVALSAGDVAGEATLMECSLSQASILLTPVVICMRSR